ncbi:hypothetical protein [Parasitella parasitica]|uniref:HMG box domain-containing protein n=1 Tax=Parasitella parasitica TaxID=35722 RepID=A0A0B7MTZ8_9FUNG|nr:hypothetical protein [Parasitella parasitica]
MQVHASSQYFTKDELEKMDAWFTKEQQQDVFELAEKCARTPPGRKRGHRVKKVDPSHIPRSSNCFIVYRTKVQAEIRYFCRTANHRDISKIISKWWHNLDKKEKNVYQALAKKAKQDHMEKYPGYIFRPKPKKSKKKDAKAKFVNNPACSYDDDQDYKPPHHFNYMDDKEIYECQKHRLSYSDAHIDRNDPSPYYYQPVVNYVPVPLNDRDGLSTNHGANMYVDPALLTSGYMDINSAEPIRFDDDNHNLSMFAMLNSTPASQIMETPVLDYYQSPVSMSYQQPPRFHPELQDTPHLLDHAVIPSGYSNEYGKLFDTLGGPGRSASVSSDMMHRSSISSVPQTDEYINFMYGSGSASNPIFADQHHRW